MTETYQDNDNVNWKNIHATRVITSILGVTLAIGGLVHGFFEILQGFKPTTGLIIQGIGEAQRFWVYGTEEAFTIIPNFMITGIASVLVSIFIIIWSIGFVHRKHGRLIFIFLFIFLFLVGGGIGQIVFFIPIWAYATRMNKPKNWWRKILPQGLRKILSKIWIYTLLITVVSFLIGLAISIFGYFPGVSNPDAILTVCWTFLFLIGFPMLNITFISGFAHDIENS